MSPLSGLVQLHNSLLGGSNNGAEVVEMFLGLEAVEFGIHAAGIDSGVEAKAKVIANYPFLDY
ncbi:hypothetical protein VP1G_11403 [Cytospora mali]|uniref:Uncharacterized protein n=1 Tax=Cytospora mali TaxID=578113 RepID=A0A194VFS1_CYTMA|nr:hypothetical protein VP1G_11403 [Valsa mali var. pyri (nom. inval.)]